jgi:hypothetical protein
MGNRAEKRQRRSQAKQEKFEASKQRRALPEIAATYDIAQESRPLSAIESQIFNDTGDGDSRRAVLNLKYYQSTYQCFSEWQPSDLKAFSSFVRKLHSSTWVDIKRSGGKDGKTGFGYTPITNRSGLPACEELDTISPDLPYFELRVSEKARVHGFRSRANFFLVWLDVNHEIFSG